MKKKTIASFEANSPVTLANEINAFLEKEEVELVDIKYSAISSIDDCDWHTALVIYEMQ